MIDARIREHHVAVLGKSGSGKTFATKAVIVEPLLDAGKLVAVVDPTSAWWGLRSSADGKGPGFKVLVLGGDHGDLPLPANGGAAVAKLIIEQRVSCVLDTGNFTVGERTRWTIDFAGAMYRLNRSPLYLVVDEAHVFAPQGKVPDPDTGRMLHAVNQIAAGGRSRGIRLTMITQRPQKLHKDALTTADTLIAMRVLAPQDRAAVKDWIDGCGDPAQGRQVLDSLAQLQKGEGWLWYPEGGVLERLKFPRIRTFDSSATPTGDHQARQPKGAADIDLTEIKAVLADAVREAEANDPKRLRARIAELEAAARKAGAGASREDLEREYRRGVHDGHNTLLSNLEGTRKRLTLHLQQMANELTTWGVMAAATKGDPDVQGTPVDMQQRGRDMQQPAPNRHISPSNTGAPPPARVNGSGGAELRILRVLACRHPARFTMPQWATLAGMKRTGGTWQTYVSRLRTAGYIEQRDGLVGVTAAGMDAAGPTERPADPIEMWKQALGGGAARMLDIIIRATPAGGIGRDGLAQALDMTASGGTFQTYLSRLRSNGLIEQDGSALRASDVLWR